MDNSGTIKLLDTVSELLDDYKIDDITSYLEKMKKSDGDFEKLMKSIVKETTGVYISDMSIVSPTMTIVKACLVNAYIVFCPYNNYQISVKIGISESSVKWYKAKIKSLKENRMYNPELADTLNLVIKNINNKLKTKITNNEKPTFSG